MCGVSRNIQQVFLRYLMMYHGQKDQLTALSEFDLITNSEDQGGAARTLSVFAVLADECQNQS